MLHEPPRENIFAIKQDNLEADPKRTWDARRDQGMSHPESLGYFSGGFK